MPLGVCFQAERGGWRSGTENRRSLDGWGVQGVRVAAEAEQEQQSLSDGGHLFARKFAKHAPDPPLVDGSQLVDQREGLLGETALAGCEGWIKESLAGSPGHRHHAHEPEALVADHVRIAHYDAWPHALLFVAGGGVKSYNDNRTAAERHLRPSTQPSPGTHRTGLPAPLSTSASASSSGRPRVHSSNPCSASSALSGWGFCRDRRSSARRRRSSSWRTASTTNLLRFFSRRSMSLTRSSGRVTVTRATVAISYSQYDHTSGRCIVLYGFMLTSGTNIGTVAYGCETQAPAGVFLP